MKYIQFQFPVGTQTRKVTEIEDPPKNKPQNAIGYRHFELNEDIPEHLANQFPEKDMLNLNPPTGWNKLEAKTSHP